MGHPVCSGSLLLQLYSSWTSTLKQNETLVRKQCWYRKHFYSLENSFICLDGVGFCERVPSDRSKAVFEWVLRHFLADYHKSNDRNKAHSPAPIIWNTSMTLLQRIIQTTGNILNSVAVPWQHKYLRSCFFEKGSLVRTSSRICFQGIIKYNVIKVPFNPQH